MKTTKRRKHPATAGFTLVELMVVISIIAILATIVGVNMIGQIDESNVKAAQAQIRNLKTAVIAYKLKNRTLPDSLEEVASGGFLETNSVPPDPWNNAYVYTRDGSKFTILCYGADGKSGGSDIDADISSDNLAGDQS